MGTLRTAVALIVTIALLSLLFVPVPVPDENAVAGAVAYTQPDLNSTYIATAQSSGVAGTTLNGIDFTATSVVPHLSIVNHKYTQPAPKFRPLWEAILKPTTVGLIGPTGPVSPIATPGATCTSSVPVST